MSVKQNIGGWELPRQGKECLMVGDRRETDIYRRNAAFAIHIKMEKNSWINSNENKTLSEISLPFH